MKTGLIIGTALLLNATAWATEESPHAKEETKRSRAPQEAVDAWKDLRFGMFIHWGPVALTGHEIGWSRGNQTPIEEYDNLYKQFNPVDFDAGEWVRVAKAAGMKYIVLTTKHHDGFCLWPSEYTDYDIGETPFKRDVVGELAAACKKQGIGFGTYYSTCDWWHPSYPKGSPAGKSDKPDPDMKKYIEYLRAQTSELINNNGPLTTVWFDVPREVYEKDNEPTVAALRVLQPDLMINDRAYSPKGAGGDYDTPEQRIGSFNDQRPWETCMTICTQWAWKPNDPVKSLEQCLRSLIATVGGDGNFLFNVGPNALGVIEPEQVARLEEMGAWISKYSDGIHATRGGPFKPAGWGASTHTGNQVYLFVFEWPSTGELTLPLAEGSIVKAENLSGEQFNLKEDATGCTLTVPPASRDAIATVVRLTLNVPASSIKPVDMPSISGSLAFGKPARASAAHFSGDAQGAFDDNPFTRWVVRDQGEQWLEVDLGQPQAVDSARIQADSAGIRLSLQALQDGEWKTVFSIEKARGLVAREFPPVTAQSFRILTNNGRPAISEFQLFDTKNN